MAGEYRDILKNTLEDKSLLEKVLSKNIQIAISDSIIGNVSIKSQYKNIFIASFEKDKSYKSQYYLNGLKNGSLIIVSSIETINNNYFLGKEEINYFNT